MKTIRIITFLLIAGIAIGSQSCKKDSEGSGGSSTVSEQQQASDDMAYMQESEEAVNDADNVMAYSSFGKGGFHIDGATIDSFGVDKKMVINYSGNNGNGSRHRSGKVSIQLTSGSHWRDQGAVITITFTNYTVKRNATGKKVIINGVYTITNVSGGSIVFLSLGDSVHHRIAGAINIMFDDGNQGYNWTITRDRVIGRTSGGAYFISLSGYGNSDGESNVAVKGTNRNGRTFFTIIASPVVLSSSCDWDATSGHVIYKSGSSTLDVLYGVDASGDPQSSGCPYGFKLSWTSSTGEAKVVVVKY
jgi:hypothetical protein